jgi:hypothetical protein
MINTNATDLGTALKIGNDFKKLVNDKYRLLEIDIDGVFQRMLLLQKKKYAALTVNIETGEATTEIKGLDMKRREYCDLSKNVSRCVGAPAVCRDVLTRRAQLRAQADPFGSDHGGRRRSHSRVPRDCRQGRAQWRRPARRLYRAQGASRSA